MSKNKGITQKTEEMADTERSGAYRQTQRVIWGEEKMTRMACLVEYRVVRPVNTTVRVTDQKKQQQKNALDSVCLSNSSMTKWVCGVSLLSLKAYFKFILRAIHYGSHFCLKKIYIPQLWLYMWLNYIYVHVQKFDW